MWLLWPIMMTVLSQRRALLVGLLLSAEQDRLYGISHNTGLRTAGARGKRRRSLSLRVRFTYIYQFFMLTVRSGCRTSDVLLLTQCVCERGRRPIQPVDHRFPQSPAS